MSDLPACPQCGSEYAYESGELYACPECGHEWEKGAAAPSSDAPHVVDANGQPLQDGDTITVIKDLKVKGASATLKRGTVFKNIRLTDDPREIECRSAQIKGLVLKTEFVKKV